MLHDGKTKVDPLGSDNPSSPEQSQLYSSDGVLAEGSRFGAYIVGACIGHGGMARIYRAEHEGLRRSVALKVLLDGFAQDPEGHERFLREGRIAAAIKHPNVVNIFDVGFQGSTPYLVMELLEGQDLEALMYSQGSMPESALVDIIVPIVAGLAAVHDAGVIHRDLKPGNIFLARGRNEEIEPKLLDFGISKAAESEQFKLTTARGLLMGTPLYMSPEAIQGGEITSLSDQYSLGVVLYECCTGFNPFAADTLAETVRRVTTGDFPPIAQQNSSVSKRMGRIIGRAMSLDPSHRFSSLREMGRELLFLAGQRTRITWSLSFGEVVAKRTGNLAALAVAPRTTPPPARQYGKLSSALAIVFGVGLFGSAIALLWSTRNSEPAQVVSARASLRTEPPAPAASGNAARPHVANPDQGTANTEATAPTNPIEIAQERQTAPPPAVPAPTDRAPREIAPVPVRSVRAEEVRVNRPALPRPAASRTEASRPEADRVRAALGDEEGASHSKRRATRPQPRRRAAPAAATARAEPQAPARPAPPDWELKKNELPPAPRPQAPRNPTAVGTNNAPIFE